MELASDQYHQLPPPFFQGLLASVLKTKGLFDEVFLRTEKFLVLPLIDRLWQNSLFLAILLLCIIWSSKGNFFLFVKMRFLLLLPYYSKTYVVVWAPLILKRHERMVLYFSDWQWRRDRNKSVGIIREKSHQTLKTFSIYKVNFCFHTTYSHKVTASCILRILQEGGLRTSVTN